MHNAKLKELVEYELTGEKESLVFIDYIDKFIETKARQGTKNICNVTRNKIELYDKKATFATITQEWLLNLENKLKERGLKINYISLHLRNIRAVFNYAINNEYTNAYPFRKFKIK